MKCQQTEVSQDKSWRKKLIKLERRNSSRLPTREGPGFQQREVNTRVGCPGSLGRHYGAASWWLEVTRKGKGWPSLQLRLCPSRLARVPSPLQCPLTFGQDTVRPSQISRLCKVAKARQRQSWKSERRVLRALNWSAGLTGTFQA